MATSQRKNKPKQPGINTTQPKAQEATGQQQAPAGPSQEVQRALDNPQTASAETLLYLQSTLGNRAVQRLLQRKLMVGPANDPLEQEADQTAQRVMTLPATALPSEQQQPVQRQAGLEEEELQAKPLLQRQAAAEEEDLQAKPAVQRSSADGFEAGAEIEQQLEANRGGGSPLPNETRAFMEPRFKADFSAVRVHADGQAADLSRSVQAQAFAHGNDIYFNEGKFSPGTDAGKQLLAHELTHTIQQGGSSLRSKKATSTPSEPVSAVSRKRIQRMPTVDQFKTMTYEGVFAGRGSMLKEIERLIGTYFDGSVIDPAKRLNIVLQIRKLTEMWISEHATDTSRTKRMVGMVKFKDELVSTVIPALENTVKKQKGNENFQVPAEYTGGSAELKRLRDRHEGSASSSLTRAGQLLDVLLPNNGDKGEVELELKVPVSPGAFVGGLLKLEGEREKGKSKVRAEVALTGGVTIGIAELRGAIGGYFEAQAPTNEGAMKLVSYGLYKRLTESSVVPSELANYFWGGSTNSVGRARSDKWAAAVEDELLDDNNDHETYVETGGLAGAKAEAGVGAKASAEIKGTSGKRYSSASVKGAKDAGTRDYSDASKVIEVKLEADASLLKGEASVKFKWLKGAYAETELELKGEVAAGSGTAMKRVGKVLQLIATRMREDGKSVVRTEDPNNAQTSGNVVEGGNSLYNAGAVLYADSADLETTVGAPEEAESLEGNGSALLNLKGAKKAGASWEIEGSINTKEEASLNAGILKGKTKKVQRIWGMKYVDGNWSRI